MRSIVASLVLSLSLVVLSAACGGDEGCPPGSVSVGDRCIASDAGPPDGAASDACIATGVETCNGLDDNCDGTIDEGLPTMTHYADADGDTFGDAASEETSCAVPTGRVLVGGDCDDHSAAARPGATETCNSIDDDCDGEVDEGFATVTHYADSDSDTYGDPASAVTGCAIPATRVTRADDCDDMDATVNPDGTELCNGVDDNCNETIDEGVSTTYYRDADGDTFGASTMSMSACSAPTGYVANATDCDDAATAVHPGALETCDATDDDCDGSIDETFTCVRDASTSCTTTCGSTGAGVCTASCTRAIGAACMPPAESCGFMDDDCDGVVDEGFGSLSAAVTNASTSKIVLLQTTDGFAAVFTTSSGIYARTFGATSSSGAYVLVTSSLPDTFDAATNGDDLIVTWTNALYEIRARRFVANTLTAYGPEALLTTENDFTFPKEIAIAMNATQVLIVYSQPSAIGFTRCTNALGSVARGTVRTTAGNSYAKLDLVADPATSEWLLAFENGGALTMQYVSPLGVPGGISTALGSAGGTEVALARGPTSSPQLYGALWLEGTTLRFETVSASGFGGTRTPAVHSAPVNLTTTARRVGAAEPLLDPIGLALSGGQWFASYFTGASAAASRMQLARSPVGDGTVAATFSGFTSPDTADRSRKATAVVGTAGNHVLLGSETAVWRVVCP